MSAETEQIIRAAVDLRKWMDKFKFWLLTVLKYTSLMPLLITTATLIGFAANAVYGERRAPTADAALIVCMVVAFAVAGLLYFRALFYPTASSLAIAATACAAAAVVAIDFLLERTTLEERLPLLGYLFLAVGGAVAFGSELDWRRRGGREKPSN